MIYQRNGSRIALCAATFGPDFDTLLRFSRVLALTVEKDFDAIKEQD
jgi:hypothetical protein